MIIELNEQNFEKEALHGLKLIEFYTTWCSFCKKQRIELIDLENSDAWVGIVDAEESPHLAMKYDIKAYPTFILLKNGEKVAQFEGFHKKSELLNKVLNV